MFTSTGAPAFFAFSLGFHDAMKGTATPTAPAAPTTDVATVRKRRRPLSTGALLIHLLSSLDAPQNIVAESVISCCDRPTHIKLGERQYKMPPNDKEMPSCLQGK